MGFLANSLNCKSLETKDSKAAFNQMVSTLEGLRPRQRSRNKVQDLDRSLNKETVGRLQKITQESHEENPFSENVQLRNLLIIEILSGLGLRKGELANIRLDDINFQKNTLKVVRRPDDPSDPRRYQPLVKTSERTLPLHDQLSLCIQEYQLNQRGKLNAARKHGYLFVSHSGGTAGQPLSIAGIDYVFKRLKLALSDPSLSPHNLRHQWNYEFSHSIDSSDDRMSEAQEDQLRSYLMGWCPTSGMASNYNRRRVVEKAHKAIEEHQRRLARMKDNNDN